MRRSVRRAWAGLLGAAAVATTLSACSSSYDPCWITDEQMAEQIFLTTRTTDQGSTSLVSYDVAHAVDEQRPESTCVYSLSSVSNSDQKFRVRITRDATGTQEDFENRLAEVEDSALVEVLDEVDGHPILGVSNVLDVAHLFVDGQYYILDWASLNASRPRYDPHRAVPLATYIVATRAGAEPDGFTAMLDEAAEAREEAQAEREAAQAEAEERDAAEREAAEREAAEPARVDPPAAPGPEATFEYSQEQIDEYNDLVEGHGPFDDAQQYDYDDGYEFGYDEGYDNGYDDWGSKTDVRTLSADQSEDFFQGFDEGYDDGFADGAADADADAAEEDDEGSGGIFGGGGDVFQDKE